MNKKQSQQSQEHPYKTQSACPGRPSLRVHFCQSGEPVLSNKRCRREYGGWVVWDIETCRGSFPFRPSSGKRPTRRHNCSRTSFPPSHTSIHPSVGIVRNRAAREGRIKHQFIFMNTPTRSRRTDRRIVTRKRQFIQTSGSSALHFTSHIVHFDQPTWYTSHY